MVTFGGIITSFKHREMHFAGISPCERTIEWYGWYIKDSPSDDSPIAILVTLLVDHFKRANPFNRFPGRNAWENLVSKIYKFPIKRE